MARETRLKQDQKNSHDWLNCRQAPILHMIAGEITIERLPVIGDIA